mmetsp:Transcript_26306/g.43404  ORF Transcript_26306/g.43404 Transcript_26306/m.43404 type:complete len:200 (+) Transcript_26306:1278-1877(+)
MPARVKSPAKATAPPMTFLSMDFAAAPGASRLARTVALVLAPTLATAVATESGVDALIAADFPVGRSNVDALSVSSVNFANNLVSALITGASLTSFSRAATLISTSFFAATGALTSSSILATNLESSIGCLATGLAGLFSIATFNSTSLGAAAGGVLLKSSSLATVRVFDVAEEAGSTTASGAAAGAAALMTSSSATAI